MKKLVTAGLSVGDRCRHFRRGTIYEIFTVATHGDVWDDSASFTAVYEPTLEKFRVAPTPDGFRYQFEALGKDLGEMWFYRETPQSILWSRCAPNFHETVVYEGKETPRFVPIH